MLAPLSANQGDVAMPVSRPLRYLAQTLMLAGLLAGPSLAHAQADGAAFFGSWQAVHDGDAVTLEFRADHTATGAEGGETAELRWAVGGADTLNGVEYTILELEIVGDAKAYARALFEGPDTFVMSEPEDTLDDSFSDSITWQRID